MLLWPGLIYTLGGSGYSVICAKAGDFVQVLVQAQDFDLIVLDFGLPDMDGLELLRSLHSRKVPLPIMVLMAHDGVNDRINDIEQGADDYMIKPLNSGKWRP